MWSSKNAETHFYSVQNEDFDELYLFLKGTRVEIPMDLDEILERRWIPEREAQEQAFWNVLERDS